ncbi:MAG: hypothetical protein K1X92_10255 [Bacteroidia bacterium]|nr:hypothetical protein [Bacteroidia bacterium]
MDTKQIIEWLLEGDISIQYQTYRDLMETEKPELQKKIETQGWGLQFFSKRNPGDGWGQRFYQPKWISTHYTLLDLKNLNIAQDNPLIKEIIHTILTTEKGPDGGILPIGTVKKCDVCVNGMFLNYAAYFLSEEEKLKSVIDFLLAEKMKDGGFNCLSNRSGATHSSLHSTISVLEGILEYERNGYTYRLDELIEVKKASHEFILMHNLFLSDKTHMIINPNFLKLYYPSRWYYDILRAMDYFQNEKRAYDIRMQNTIDELLKKRTKSGLWNLSSGHPGKVHFIMEEAGKPSRWNTLRVLRVLKHFGISI